MMNIIAAIVCGLLALAGFWVGCWSVYTWAHLVWPILPIFVTMVVFILACIKGHGLYIKRRKDSRP